MLSTISLSLRPAYVRQYDDGTRPKDVTVDERHRLAEPFEKYRSHLHAVAYRMLGRRARRMTPSRKRGYGSAARIRGASRTWEVG